MSSRRSRRSKNREQRSNSNKSSATSSGEKGRGLGARAGSLYRRLRAFVGSFKAARGRRGQKASENKDGLVSRLLKKGATALTVITLVVVAVAFVEDLFTGNKVVIKSFDISPELQGKFNDEMFANLLKHEISIRIHEAKSIRKSKGIEVPLMTNLPDVQVPVTNVPVKTLMRYIQESRLFRYVKRVFGLNPIEVNGAVLPEGDKIKINLSLKEGLSDDLPQRLKTVALDPNNFDPAMAEVSEFILDYAEPYIWAAYLYQTKQTDKARGQVEYCKRKNPDENMRMALVLSGLILMDDGKYDKAIAEFDEATKNASAGRERERELAVAYSNWGLALLYKCRPEEAIAKLEESIRHDQALGSTYNNYGKALIEIGKTDEAVVKLERALELDHDIATAYFNLGRILADEKPNEAVRKYMAAINLDPNYVEAYSGLGGVLVANFSDTHNDEVNDEAFEKLNKAIKLDDKFAPAYINRALAWDNQNNFDKAIEDGEKAVRFYPMMSKDKQGCDDFKVSYSHAYNNLGWFYEEKKLYEPAVANYQKAINLDPKYHYAYAGKADALREWGGSHVKESQKIYEWVLQEPDADQRSRLAAFIGNGKLLLERSRGRSHAEKKADLEQSISMFEEALKLKQNDKEVEADLEKAQAALRSLSK